MEKKNIRKGLKKNKVKYEQKETITDRGRDRETGRKAEKKNPRHRVSDSGGLGTDLRNSAIPGN